MKLLAIHFFKMIITCLCLLSMNACTWKDMESWAGSGIWSDDNRTVVAAYNYYEGQNAFTYVRTRNYESEVYLMTYGDHNDAPSLLMTRSVGKINQLYHMSSANYLIVAREERLEDLDDDLNHMSNFYLDHIASDGTQTSLGTQQALTMMSCDEAGESSMTTGEILSGFPSPDGSLIALVRTDPSCDESRVEISFLDASTLETIGNRFNYVIMNQASFGLSLYAWLDQERFASAAPSFQGLEGKIYTPFSEPTPLTDNLEYDCFYPATTSSGTNALGEEARVEEDGSIRVLPTENAITFGCP